VIWSDEFQPELNYGLDNEVSQWTVKKPVSKLIQLVLLERFFD